MIYKKFLVEYIYLFRSLRLIFCCYFLIVKKEPSVHVLTETFIGVPIIVVQILGCHVHAGRHSPAERSDRLKHNDFTKVVLMRVVMMFVMVVVVMVVIVSLPGE